MSTLDFFKVSQIQLNPQLQGSQLVQAKTKALDWEEQMQGLHWHSIPQTQRAFLFDKRLFIGGYDRIKRYFVYIEY